MIQRRWSLLISALGVASVVCQFVGLSLALHAGNGAGLSLRVVDYLLLVSIVLALLAGGLWALSNAPFCYPWLGSLPVVVCLCFALCYAYGWVILLPQVRSVREADIRLHTKKRLERILAALHEYAHA